MIAFHELLVANVGESRVGLPFELALFGVAVVLTLAVVGVFIFAVLRHGNRDSQGRTPDPRRDREAT